MIRVALDSILDGLRLLNPFAASNAGVIETLLAA
jgi:hypothetical protein